MDRLLTAFSAEPLVSMDPQSNQFERNPRHLIFSEGIQMNGKHFAQQLATKRNLLAALAAGAVLTTGCSNMMTTAPTLAPQVSGGQLSGSVHGGSQPVAFATVTLYYGGTSGAGSGDPSSGGVTGAPIVAAVTTSADDGHGSFSFQKSATNGQTTTGNNFSCPAAGDPLVYVVARGGNTLNSHDSSVNNSAAAFLAVFGTCSQINASSFVNMTEVTTVASMVALQQYFNPVTESFGADGIAVATTAFNNTLSTISNLANVATGQAAGPKTITGAGSVSVTVTPQTTKINSLANIIASCVNNATASAAPCVTLFNNATPPDTAVTSRPYKSPAFPQATDVLQGLYYMLSNPTNGSSANLQNLYNLIPAVGSAFQPTLTAAPTDWTVAITYSSTGTCGTSSGNFISKPQDLSIDNTGNIWIANGQDTTGNLSAISSAGVPVACTTSGGGALGGSVVDAMGNVWTASPTTSTITRYTPGTSSSAVFTTPVAPLAIFADGGDSGNTVSNIYFTSAATSSLYMIPQGATAATTTTPVQISSVVGANPTHIMIGKDQAIWVSSGSNFVSRVVTGVSGDPNYLNGFSTTQFTVDTDSYGISINDFGTFVSSTNANSSISLLAGSGTSYSMLTGWPATAGTAGLSRPTAIAVDGRSNVWTVNLTPNAVSGLNSLSEITQKGVPLFPSGTDAGGLQLDPTYLSVGRAIIIDQSGNVWVANEGPAGTPANFVTEIVGAAAPVYQPYARGLANGRFQNMP
jgi:streptogramin lyase